MRANQLYCSIRCTTIQCNQRSFEIKISEFINLHVRHKRGEIYPRRGYAFEAGILSWLVSIKSFARYLAYGIPREISYSRYILPTISLEPAPSKLRISIVPRNAMIKQPVVHIRRRPSLETFSRSALSCIFMHVG